MGKIRKHEKRTTTFARKGESEKKQRRNEIKRGREKGRTRINQKVQKGERQKKQEGERERDKERT